MIILLAGVLPLVAVRLPVLRRALPVPGWVGAVGCCMHALVDGTLRVLSVLGAHPTQLPASAWTSFDRHASVTRPKRRAWLVSAVAGCLALTAFGVIATFTSPDRCHARAGTFGPLPPPRRARS